MEYSYKDYKVPYMICFCIVKEKVLMLYRFRSPNENMWNGIGGKFEDGETLDESLKREVMEEAGLDVTKGTVHYSGIITWNSFTKHSQKGMYAYIVDFSESILFEKRETSEGILEWKNIQWVCDKTNSEVVDNIPFFLPEMLKRKSPMYFHCEYSQNGKLSDFTISQLNPEEVETP